MELLKQLYCIHSKSNKEDKMLSFLIDWLFRELPGANIEMDKTGNLYVSKGEAETYPCIVAHIDQVQTNHSDDFEAIETNDIIFGYSQKNRRYEGLGADDKNGVWVALKCLLKYDVLKVALFVGEETGCVGSNNADMDFFDDCRFVLQCDRRGFDDFITEASCTELCGKEFTDDVHFDWFGYKESHGMMTDVMTLKENGLKVSCVNISCGYYKPHTDDEFTIKYDLLNCLYFVEYIIENCIDVYPHEYVYKPKTTTIYGYGGTYKGYGSYNSQNGNVSNGLSYNQTTKKEVEEKTQDNSIQKFGDYSEENDWVSEISKYDYDDDNNIVLSEEQRDELYDVIYSLLSDCPSASYDMIRSAILHTYPNLSEQDIYATYGEVKYDMRKYFNIPCY